MQPRVHRVSSIATRCGRYFSNLMIVASSQDPASSFLDWRRELLASMEHSAKFLDLPTRSEVNTVLQRVKTLEEEVRVLRKAAEPKAAEPKAAEPKAAARKARPARPKAKR